MFLGIDTSNYRTSCALFSSETGWWQNEGELLAVPQGTIGLRQSDALFQHTVKLGRLIEKLPREKCGKLRAVGVSTRPREIEGSYMPCFLAGENTARSAAHLLDVPLFLCSHQQGHLAAAALSAGRLDLLYGTFLAWHLSGGTTELLLVKPGKDNLPHAQIIGGTQDLSAGQLVDRAGNALGLSFPAGAQLDLLAQQTEGIKGFQPKVENGLFSLSGVQNKVEDMAAKGASPAETARFTIETVANAVVKATKQAAEKYPYPILCAGGVMANSVVRARMEKEFGAWFAEPVLSGDNAVGAAVLAAMQNGEDLCSKTYTQSQS